MAATEKINDLLAEVEELRRRLQEAEETILAIRSGGMDAFVMRGPNSDHVSALEGADRRYRQLIEHMQQGVAALRPDGTIFYCNRCFADLLGTDLAKLPGAALFEFMPADQAFVCRELLRKGAVERSSGETMLLRGDGKSVPAHLTFNALPLEDQRLVALLVTDLSDQHARQDAERETHRQLESEYLKRVQAEEALRRGEQRYRAFIQQTSEAVWRFELDEPIPVELPVDEQLDRAFRLGYLAECNDAMARMYGFETAEQLIGTRLPDLVVTSDTGNWRRLRACIEAGYRLNDVESLERDRDGNPRIFLNNIVGTVEDGRLVRVWGTQRDITERRQAEDALRANEQRFRLMADTVPAIVWTADPDGTITYASERWYRYTGLTPEQNLRWIDLVLHPDDRARCVEAWTHALNTGSDYQIEVRNRRHDGVYRWFLTRAVPVHGADGRIAAWFGSTTDIEDQKRAEETLQEADRRKDEFLAVLAHELRNPLGPIRNAVQILNLVGSQEATSKNARAMIERQIAHMARLIDDLLDVSRISRGKVLLRKERCELTEIVRTTTEDYRGILESTGLKLTVEVPPGPLWVLGDSTRLAQVLGNLLHNANKFTDAGGQVHVRLTRDPGGRFVSIAIRDTGIGMEPGILRRMFEPFSQADQSIDRSRGGLGLGLALVKGLVELHGGRVTARSEGIAKGSEFTITLPLSDMPMLLTHAGPTRPAAALRVLLVEDHPDAAESMKVLLSLAGHQVEAACNGLAALELAETFRPQVIVCDISLPGGMDGYEVARSLRLDPAQRDTFLIALTGYGQDDDQRRAQQAGFDWHMVKPVDFDELHGVLTAIASPP